MRKNIWYDECDVVAAWDQTVMAITMEQQQNQRNSSSASSSSSVSPASGGGGRSCFDHDAVDITRQALTNALFPIYTKILLSARNGNSSAAAAAEFKHLSGRFLDLVEDVGRLMATDEMSLLGRWLEAAKGKANNQHERTQYEFNARNQGSYHTADERESAYDRFVCNIPIGQG